MDADAAAAAAKADADAAAAAATQTTNIFTPPATTTTTAPALTGTEITNIFEGQKTGGDAISTGTKAVVDTGGTTATTTTDTTTNIGEYRPPDSTTIGADGGKPTLLPTVTVTSTPIGGGTIFDPNALGGAKGPGKARSTGVLSYPLLATLRVRQHKLL